jgi:lon-related putative ATP-dependent protease
VTARKRPVAKPAVVVPAPLPADRLVRRCSFDPAAFQTTADLAGLDRIVGQDRAREAVRFAIGVASPGYNLFVLGSPGLGKRTLVREVLEARARNEPPPDDWVHVNNFRQPHRPWSVRLPHGMGVRLKTDMARTIEDLRAAVPSLFESDEYRNRAEHIGAGTVEHQDAGFQALGAESAGQGIGLLRTPSGFSLAPVKDGEVIAPDDYRKLPEAERDRIDAALADLQVKLQKTIRHAQQLQQEGRARLRELGREMTRSVVEMLLDPLRHTYGEVPRIGEYLAAMQDDILENVDLFRRTADGEGGNELMRFATAEAAPFTRFEVNVIVGDHDDGAGAPVVVEDNPTHPNLIGRIEFVARFGTLATDFSQIRGGALHRANGGYLLVDAYKLLTQPFAWDAVKRALSGGELKPESAGQSLGLVSTVAIEPEPIPLRLKMVLFGERELYYLLSQFDPDFEELFKVAADFGDDVERTPDTEMEFARMIATQARRESLPPFDRAAVARVIEQTARWTGDAERLSAHIEGLGDLMREAAFRCVDAGGGIVGERDVQAAIDARIRRSNRIPERLREMMLRGELLLDTSGARIGQINGLSVGAVGQHAFGFPVRITATARIGDGDVTDIQREVQLSGPIHAKGVMILAAFLADRYSAERPHAVSASLVFEQTYGEVDGDSASVAEACALLSAIGGFPVKQCWAITGSMNQHGVVQPIGGVNDKIEGYFDICARRGLDGEHGVIIPSTNVAHLMLREDVVAAVAAGKFRIHAVSTIDEALALLTGLPAGEPNADGLYPEGSANYRVASRLMEFSLMRQAYAQMQVRVKTVRPAKEKAAKPRKPAVPKRPTPRPPKPGVDE